MNKLVRILAKLARILVRLLAGFGMAALVLAALLADFMNRSSVDRTLEELPRTAIVFTGHFDRIDLGLDLLSTGRIDRLFITGVNGDAGLNVGRFAEQFDLSPEQAAWIETGKIALAADAHTTFENAWEAGCWLDQTPDIEAVALITSRRHMARASVALQNTAWPIDVVRVVSDPEAEFDPMLLNLVDFGEFAATWGITLLPYSLWPANMPSICRTEASDDASAEAR